MHLGTIVGTILLIWLNVAAGAANAQSIPVK